MIPTQDNFPVFETNQILTSGHLNQLFDYLDEQGRLTRADLIGIGIVCGLEFTLSPGATPFVTISKGCGITSEGYLVTVPEDMKLDAYKPYTLPTEVEYPLLNDLSDAGMLNELVALKYEPDAPGKIDPLGSYVIMLFLELKKAGLRNCSPNNCDDKGAAITVQVRPLLIGKSDADKIIGENTLVKFQESAVLLQEVPLPRIDFSKPGLLQDFETTYCNYFNSAIKDTTVIERLTSALKSANACLVCLIPDLDEPDWDTLLKTVFSPPAQITQVQYYYDFLRDLTSAYHELRDAMLEQVSICMPASEEFPRHLWLGLMQGTHDEHYRTRFYPSPAVSVPEKSLNQLRFLFDRMNNMISGFAPPEKQFEFKITPSIWGTKYLSGRSMPFYYHPGLRSSWDARRKDAATSLNVLSYHVNPGSPDHVQNPLEYDLEPYNFLRFEGLVGNNALKFSMELPDILKNNQLPVSLLFLDADSSQSFLDKHPGITHEAGVLRGGTFVVLQRGTGQDANQVVADFALPYRIEEADQGCLCRVTVRECDFEWFETPRHLANLAMREYRPDLSENSRKRMLENHSVEDARGTLYDNYVILIYKYEITGSASNKTTSLIGDSPTEVKVPIEELKTEKLSAVARHLNAAFPDGVIFDHKPGTNKIIIRYFSDQTFRLELGGLQGNQVRYAWEPGRIYRWQNKYWESLAKIPGYRVTCRLRDEYRAKEYRWLQQNEFYQAEYPAVSPMPTAEELIKWEKMISLRARKPLPEEIQSIIQQITSPENWKNLHSYSVHGLVLIGSWANGSWVSKKDERANKVKGRSAFLKLREKITGKKNKPSDIDLLIHLSDMTKLEDAKSAIKGILLEIKPSYKVNVLFGKKDAQKGIDITPKKGNPTDVNPGVR